MDEFEVDIRIKQYLRKHLKLRWELDKDCNHYLALQLDGQTISKVPFAAD
jgi:hypothetical protein